MDGDRARGPHDDSAPAQARIIVRAAWRPGHPGVGRPSAYLDGSIAVSTLRRYRVTDLLVTIRSLRRSKLGSLKVTLRALKTPAK